MKAIVLMAAAACVVVGPEEPTKPVTPRVREPGVSQPVPEGAGLYHTLAGREAQVVFTTDAPLEKIVGKSNEVVGYAVSGPKEHPEQLRAGVWLLPIESLATGIPLRDEHLAGADWMDAKGHPNIQFELTGVEDVKSIKAGEGFSTFGATLVGRLTMHGVTKELRVSGARLSFFDESAKTREIAPGNLLFIKCDYRVTLSDFGVKNKDVPQKVSDTITISQTLRLSTQAPAEGAK